ncbi:MAG: T9SS type A sorting domain-containing protein [Bacteroidetes bacterium]|nr:MAG: T9SS type A sorting domain-containing protein [Bacteroidota bacterium]
MKNFILSTCLLATCCLFGEANAQSLNGNVVNQATNEALHYGTVDIYNGEKLVSSVLTDAEGNFNVALDSGDYRCEIRFSGLKPIIQKVRVRGDVNTNFRMEGDKSRETEVTEDSKLLKYEYKVSDKSEKRVRSYESTGRSSVTLRNIVKESFSAPPIVTHEIELDAVGGKDISSSAKAYHGKGASAGVLTGGEVNDFAKISFWNDLVKAELNTYQKAWKISPMGRYTLQLMDQNGIPLADAQVSLVNSSHDLLYQARTDNTGKAELWRQTGIQQEVSENENYELIVNYQGMTQRIRKAKAFQDGINTMELEASCDQNKNVDIAFVVDATGSMGDEIDFLKKELNEIIFQSKKINSSLNFRFANVFYRDRGDSYLVRKQNFTRVLTESAQFIDKQGAQGGGDYPEAVDVALDSAINTLSWSEEARTRLLFLVLDAPPHGTDRTLQKLEELMRQAASQGIRVVPLAASGINKSTEYLMRCLALGTNGTYLYLSDHSGVGNSHIKPSADSLKTEKIRDVMTRIITNYVVMPDCEQNIPDVAPDYPDSLVEVVPPKDSLETTQPETLEWSFYPNPNFGMLNIRSNQDIDSIYLTDMNGKILQIIERVRAHEIKRVNLSNYASGIYLLRYPKGDKLISGKLILVRDR